MVKESLASSYSLFVFDHFSVFHQHHHHHHHHPRFQVRTVARIESTVRTFSTHLYNVILLSLRVLAWLLDSS